MQKQWEYLEIKRQLDATDVFYCRSYCLHNMFQASLCQSSGARKYYTVGCCLWYLVLWFSSCRYGVELRVVCLVCGLLLLPETCWASNKICKKKHPLHLFGILFPHINDDARSKSLKKWEYYLLKSLLVSVLMIRPYMENWGFLLKMSGPWRVQYKDQPQNKFKWHVIQ